MKHVFPKWFYHKEVFPEGKIIRSQAEFDEMPKGAVENWGDLEKPIDAVPENESEKMIESGEAEIPAEPIEKPEAEEVEELKEKVKRARARRKG